MVAYVEGMNEGQLNVVTQTLDGGALEQWTVRPGVHLHPRFSGDGKWLAFSGPYGPKGIHQIAYPILTSGSGDGEARVERPSFGL